MDIDKGEIWQLFQKGSSISHSLTTSGLIFIGCEECDIILQSPGVEKRHAVISYDTLKQEFWIKDLNSVTGTYINGVRIPEQSYFKLSHEDSIRFGYGPIFTLKRKSTDDSDNSRSEPQPTEEEEEEDDRTDLVDSLEDIRESMLSYSSSGSRTLLPSSGATNNLSTVVSCSESNNSRSGSSHSGNNTSAAESPVAGTPTHQPKRTFSPENESSQINNFSHFQNPPLSPSKLSEVSVNSSASSKGSRTFSGRDSAENNNLPSNSSAMSDDRNDQITQSSTGSKKEEVKIINGSGNNSQNGEKETSPVIVAAAPMAFTIPFDSDSSSSSRTFTRRKPPSRLKEKQVQQHDSFDESPPTRKQDSKKSRVCLTNAPKTEIQAVFPLNPAEIVTEPLSETATYLIQRMLGETETPRSPINRLPSSGWETSPKGTWIKKKKSSNCPPGGSLSSSSSSPSHQHHPPSRSSPATSSPSSPLPPAHPHHPYPNGGDNPPNRTSNDDNDDAKSETGTYTVDTEQLDPQVDEARKKIDEVFGLQEQKKRSDSYSNNLSSAGKQTDNLKERVNHKLEREEMAKTGAFKSPYLSKQSVGSLDEDRENYSSQNSRMIPAPPPQRPPRNSLGRSNTVTKLEPNLTSVSSRSALALSTTGGRRHNSSAEDNNSGGLRKSDKGSRGSSRDALSDGCSPPPQRRLATLSTSLHGPVTGSHRSNSLGGEESGLGGEGYFWRRKSWNLSCSDLDNNKSETGSVVSDLSTSTEPSSHSSCCGSGSRHRNNSGRSGGAQDANAPTMRLNRAFALRRARLGFESDDALTSSSSPQGIHSPSPGYSSTGGSRDLSRLPPKNLPINQPRNNTSLGSNLSRHDGGRFSLRLPRGSQPVGARIGGIGGRTSNVVPPSPSSIKPPSTPTQYQSHSRQNSGSNWVPPANQRANSKTPSGIDAKHPIGTKSVGTLNKAVSMKNLSIRSPPQPLQQKQRSLNVPSSSEESSEKTHVTRKSSPLTGSSTSDVSTRTQTGTGRGVKRGGGGGGGTYNSAASRGKGRSASSVSSSSVQKSASFSNSKDLPKDLEVAIAANTSTKRTTSAPVSKRGGANTGGGATGKKNQAPTKFVRRESAAPANLSSRNVDQNASSALSGSDSSTHAKSKREVSALDGLVITAVHQLSNKLKVSSCELLEKERLKYPERSEGRLMIDEVLPTDKKSPKQTPTTSSNEGSLTRDLSTILKNLKKVQQTLEVLTSLSDQCKSPLGRTSPYCEAANQDGSGQNGAANRQRDKRSFFIVDV